MRKTPQGGRMPAPLDENEARAVELLRMVTRRGGAYARRRLRALRRARNETRRDLAGMSPAEAEQSGRDATAEIVRMVLESEDPIALRGAVLDLAAVMRSRTGRAILAAPTVAGACRIARSMIAAADGAPPPPPAAA